MNTHSLKAPASGLTSTLAYASGEALDFSFDPTAATFTRDGGNLTLTFENDGQIVIPGFFDGKALPSVTLADGTTLDGGDFLKSMNPDIEISTALGPSSVGPDAGGIGSYADNAGDLVLGIDRLGSLGTDHWSKQAAGTETPAALTARFPGTDADMGGTERTPPPAGLPDTDAPTQEPHINYIARAVLYRTDPGAADPIRFYLMDANGKPVKAQGSELENNAPVSFAGLVDTGNITHNPDGTFSFGLSEAGNAALEAALADAGGDYSRAANLFDYITFTYDGRSYGMQVVINSNNAYTPADAEADRMPDGPLYGEWHSQNTVLRDWGRDWGLRETGDGHDVIWMQNPDSYSTNCTWDTGAGNDAVYLRGPSFSSSLGRENTVHLGEGDNSFTTLGYFASGHGGGISASTGGVTMLTAGSGMDTVHIGWGVTAGSGGTSIIDTGTGAGDSVSVHFVNSENQGASCIIKTGGTLTVGAQVYPGALGEGGYVYADRDSQNILESGGDMTVAKGLQATYVSSNTLKSGGNMSIGGSINTRVTSSTTLESDGTLTVHGQVLTHQGGTTATLKSGGDMTVHQGFITQLGAVTADSESDITIMGGITTLDRSIADITAAGHVDITHRAPETQINLNQPLYGMSAYDPSASTPTRAVVTGKTVSLTVEASANQGNTFAMYAEGYEYPLDFTEKDKAEHTHAATNKLVSTGKGETLVVTALGGSGTVAGMYAIGGDQDWHPDITAANKIVSAGGVLIDAGGERSGNARGLDAVRNAGNFINAEGAVDVDADGWWNSISLASGGNGATNAVMTTGGIEITAGTRVGSQYATGIKAYSAGENKLEADGDITVAAKATLRHPSYDVAAKGLEASGKAKNTLDADGNIEISAVVDADRGDVRGVYAGGNSGNHIHADGNVAVTAAGGHYGRGVDAYTAGAGNTIHGNGVTVTNITSRDAVGVAASYLGENRITGDSFLSVTAGRPGYAPNENDGNDWASGVWGFRSGKNVLESQGVISITAQYGYTTNGLRAEEGDNTLIGGTVAVTALGGSNTSYGLAAKDGGVNLIRGHAEQGVTVTVTASAGAVGEALALWAHGGGSVNHIKGSSVAAGNGRPETSDEITLTGGLHAAAGGVNLIETGSGGDRVSVIGSITGSGTHISTGAGKDVISLNGFVQSGSLTISAGEEFDVLVLAAPDVETFRLYYEDWLHDLSDRGLIDGMGIDAVTVSLGGEGGVTANLSDLSLLNDYLGVPVRVETGAGNDVLHLDGTDAFIVDLGDGNDRLTVGAGATGSVLHGGGGNDMLHLTVDGLSDAAGQAEVFFGQNTLSGFESVLLDLTDSGPDVVDMDHILGSALPDGADLYITAGGSAGVTSADRWEIRPDDVVTVDDTKFVAWTNNGEQTVYLEIGFGFMN